MEKWDSTQMENGAPGPLTVPGPDTESNCSALDAEADAAQGYLALLCSLPFTSRWLVGEKSDIV